MKRTYHTHNIRAKRSYSSEEIAEALHLHIQTVRHWRKNGLQPLEGSLSPLLFLGSDVKDFLKKQNNKHKVTLQPDEFYCLRCKIAVKPLETKTIDRGFLLGNGKASILTTANCPKCDCPLYKFGSKVANQQTPAAVINTVSTQPLYHSLSNR